jgi:hypothetical protein
VKVPRGRAPEDGDSEVPPVTLGLTPPEARPSTFRPDPGWLHAVPSMATARIALRTWIRAFPMVVVKDTCPLRGGPAIQPHCQVHERGPRRSPMIAWHNRGAQSERWASLLKVGGKADRPTHLWEATQLQTEGSGGRTRSLSHRVRRRLFRRIYLDRGPDHRSAVVLAGSPRSGTTWISEVLNHDLRYRFMWEPFHPREGVFPARTYLRPDYTDAALLAGARSILAGRVRSAWVDKHNRRFLPRRRLIKEVYGNLLLGWLHQQFPELPLVLILRHPCAVAASQLTLERERGWNFFVNPRALLQQPALRTDFLEPFVNELAGPLSEFESHVAVWCIENLVPLHQLGGAGIHIAFYEDFCIDPEVAFGRLFSFLGLSLDQTALQLAARPSTVAKDYSAIVTDGDLVRSWVKRVSPEDRVAAARMAARFGLARLYSEDPLPVGSALDPPS